MRLFSNKLLFFLFLFLFSFSLYAEYKININYESDFLYDSQKLLVEELKKTNTKKEIEILIKQQEWIETYILFFKPFKKEVYISILNKEPIFSLNNDYFFDKNLNKFEFDNTSKKFILVNGQIDNLSDVLKLIEIIEQKTSINYEINTINYSHVNGWDVNTGDTLIRFGKDLTVKKIDNFVNTSNYLFEISRIPSIIDIRYKDGVALSYGK
ncbi:MAG: hypothetical protein CMD58_05200 [Gammaproteobacteria bacterium]|nr:hypothetical protein [Gammaproteobacteria bacterium]